MSPQIKYFITADYATIDSSTGKLSVNGFFDTFTNTTFPAATGTFYVILGITNISKEEEIILHVIDPDGERVLEIEVGVASKNENDIVNAIGQVQSMPLPVLGVYKVLIYSKSTMEIINESRLSASYPPQRTFADGEIEKIIGDPSVAKGAQIGVKCPKCEAEYRFELNLDKSKKLAEGFLPFPESNLFQCPNDDQVFDLTGIRRQVEWNFGKPLKELK